MRRIIFRLLLLAGVASGLVALVLAIRTPQPTNLGQAWAIVLYVAVGLMVAAVVAVPTRH
jgi:hypothetical protein